jgi:hypothetical protein
MGAGAVALGPRAGARVRQAHLGGFDLDANVWVAADDRAGLERLCRYVLHPPFAQERAARRHQR